MPPDTELAIVLVLPQLLGTYGDGGNAQVLARRLEWRGRPCRVVRCLRGADVPDTADVYLLGGGEDGPQELAARELAGSGLVRAAERGAPVLAVCAGFQILGTTFEDGTGRQLDGLGLFACDTSPRPGRRIGEIVVEPEPDLGLPPLTGFENHAGATRLGSGQTPLGRVVAGEGNAVGDGTEGAVRGHRVGTYLHGPVLARNPALADRLLEWVAGPLEPLDDHDVDRLRAERLAVARAGRAPRPRSATR